MRKSRVGISLIARYKSGNFQHFFCCSLPYFFTYLPTYAILYLGNEKQLEIIETAMFIVVLDESRPKNDSEVSWSLMVGKPQNR